MESKCVSCPFNDVFWESAKNDTEKEKLVIRKYYYHQFNPSCLGSLNCKCTVGPNCVCNLLLSILSKFSCVEIIEILKQNFHPYVLEAKDIPQFSNFETCYYRVPHDLEASGLESVSFDKMGFFLRDNGPRKEGADKKYGENQAKTSAMLGLCTVSRKDGIRLSDFGHAFNKLTAEEKESLKGKLCLYIPMMQNFFLQGENPETLHKDISILSESTIKRRLPNVKYIVRVIFNTLNHELYGSQH